MSPPSTQHSGWILEADEQQFFPSLDHDMLLELILWRMRSEALAESFVRFLAVWGAWSETPRIGIPLGTAVPSRLSYP